MQVVAADEDAGAFARVEAYLGNTGLSKGRRVSAVQQRHGVYTVLAGVHEQGRQRIGIHIVPADGGQRVAHEGHDTWVCVAQSGGMLVIGRHALEAVEYKLAQRPVLGMGVAAPPPAPARGRHYLLHAVYGQGQLVYLGQGYAGLAGLGLQPVAQGQPVGYELPQPAVVKVGIGDGGKEGSGNVGPYPIDKGA